VQKRIDLITVSTLDLDLEACQYLLDIDREGLKWPTDLLVEVVTQMFLVFPSLLSKEYEQNF